MNEPSELEALTRVVHLWSSVIVRALTTSGVANAAERAGRSDPRAEAERYLAKAVAAGKVAFGGDSAAKGDEDLLKLAQLIGPMARERLGDSETAFQIWQGAIQRIAAGESV